jgi:hypothetical protein
MRLVVHNKVNGEPVVRPTWMTDTDAVWLDWFGIRELEGGIVCFFVEFLLALLLREELV